MLRGTKLNDVVLVFNVKTFSLSLKDMYDFVDTGLGNVQPTLIIFQGYEQLSYYIGRNSLSKYPVIQLKNEPIGQTMAYLKLRIKTQLKTDHTVNNVVGIIEGKQKDKYVLLTAHYDGLGMFGDIVFPGAQDNAIGVATILDLASYFAKSENKPLYSLVFIAFAGEEIGLLGSKYFVDNPIIPLEKINLVLNLDLVGSGSTGLQVINGNANNTERIFNAIEKINNEELYFYKLIASEHRCIGNHCPFVVANVPALFLMTMGAEHKWSHSIYDSYENLPFTKYDALFKLLRDFITTYKY